MIVKTILYRDIEIIVGKTSNKKATTSAIPTLERKYSMLAPAGFNDSPTVPPTSGIIWTDKSFAVLAPNESPLEAKRDCDDITVVNISVINPTKNVNIFFMPQVSEDSLLFSKNAEVKDSARQDEIIISTAMAHIFSVIDRKTISP